MGKAHDVDLRWRVIFAIWWDGLGFDDVARKLSVTGMPISATWVREMWTLFQHTHDVVRVTNRRAAPPANQLIDEQTALIIIETILDAPEATLNEHHATVTCDSGKHMHLSTFCRAVHRLGFTRQRLQQFARRRDEHQAALFRNMIKVRGYKAHMFLVVDETSKDERAMRRSFGYALRGQTPIGASGLLDRGQRLSALCSFDVGGFVDYELTEGTFDRETFLDAAERVICDHITPFPGPRSIVLIDNASIHRSVRLMEAVNARGGMLMFTPPYCWDLTPLDNNAFGLVKRWLQDRSTLLKAMPNYTFRGAFELALQHAVTPSGARQCFHRCLYEF